MTESFLHTIQIIVATVLIVSVLLQGGGAGFSSILGGGESFHTRRGVEKVLFFTTILTAIVFVLVVFVDLLI